MSGAILFDRDRVEHLDDISERPRLLRGTKLPGSTSTGNPRRPSIASQEAFELDEDTCAYLLRSGERAIFDDHGRYIHVTTHAPDKDDYEQLIALECVVGENWVLTAHDQPIPVLDEFTDQVSGSGDTGSLDGPGFLAALLEWVLGAYSGAFEQIEQQLEEFDIQAMRGESDAEKDIELIAMRREVGTLRRALAAHRTPLVALTHPELEALNDHNSIARSAHRRDHGDELQGRAVRRRGALLGRGAPDRHDRADHDRLRQAARLNLTREPPLRHSRVGVGARVDPVG